MALAHSRLAVGDASYHVTHGGSGPPVLLLHGFPRTHRCWHAIVPRRRGGPHGEGYTKREMAADLVTVMAELDHEPVVTRVAVVNVLPTPDQFERMRRAVARVLAVVPAGPARAVPEADDRRVTGARVRHVAERPGGHRRGRPRGVPGGHDTGHDRRHVRASFHVDRRHDAADRAAARRITAPLLVVARHLADAPTAWTRWAEDVAAVRLPGGHFTPEEAPDELRAALADFLAR